MDQQLYERILHEFRDCCRFCTHYPLSSTETPCHTCIDKHFNEFGEPRCVVSGRAFEPADPAYFEALCDIYETYHERRAAAVRELDEVEKAIRKVASKSKLDMWDVKHVFQRIK